MAVNVAGFFHITQRAAAEMLKQGSGHIVSITTTIVDQPMVGVPAALAALTKGALNAATRSLAILRRVLRAAPDGLPKVSTFTIWQVLHGAGYAFQRTRTWCPTGSAVRKRKAGTVTVTDPDADAKKS